MSDLPNRLRAEATMIRRYWAPDDTEDTLRPMNLARADLMASAADEIERLTRQHVCDRNLSDGVQREINAMGADVARLTAEVDQARSFLAANERGWQGTFARLENELSVARHTIESWQREVGGREADIDRLRALLERCVRQVNGNRGAWEGDGEAEHPRLAHTAFKTARAKAMAECDALLADIERELGGEP